MGQSTAVRTLQQQTNDAVELRAALKDYADDPEIILTAIEGETNFNEAIALVYGEIIEDEILLDGLETKLKEMKDRKERVTKSIAVRREIILMAMERAGVDTVKTPTATLSKRATPITAVIEDEALIPSRFWVSQDPKLDKTSLTNAVRDGESIPGVSKSNGGIALSIRKA
jgi:hypothetical protein